MSKVLLWSKGLNNHLNKIVLLTEYPNPKYTWLYGCSEASIGCSNRSVLIRAVSSLSRINTQVIEFRWYAKNPE